MSTAAAYGQSFFHRQIFDGTTNPNIIIVNTNKDVVDPNDGRTSLREAILQTQQSDVKNWEIRFVSMFGGKYEEEAPQLHMGYWAIKLKEPLPTISKNNIAINYFKPRRVTLIPGEVIREDKSKSLKEQQFKFPTQGKGNTNGSMLNIGDTDLDKSGNQFKTNENWIKSEPDSEGILQPKQPNPLLNIDYPRIAINNFNFLKNKAKGGDGTNGGGGGLGAGGAISLFSGDLNIENSLFQGLSAEGGKGGNSPASGGSNNQSGGSGGNGGLFSGGFGTPGKGGGGGAKGKWTGELRWIGAASALDYEDLDHKNINRAKSEGRSYSGGSGTMGSFGSGGGAGGGGGGGAKGSKNRRYSFEESGWGGWETITRSINYQTSGGSGGNGGASVGGAGAGAAGRGGSGGRNGTNGKTIDRYTLPWSGPNASSEKGGDGMGLGGAITIYSTNILDGAPLKYRKLERESLPPIYIPVYGNAQLNLSSVDFIDNKANNGYGDHIFQFKDKGAQQTIDNMSTIGVNNVQFNGQFNYNQDLSIFENRHMVEVTKGSLVGLPSSSMRPFERLDALDTPFHFALSTEKNSYIADTRQQVINHTHGKTDISTVEFELANSGPTIISADSSALNQSIQDLWRKQYPDKEEEILEKYSLKNMALNAAGNAIGIGIGFSEIPLIGNVIKTTKFGVAAKILQNSGQLIHGIISSNTKKKEELEKNAKDQKLLQKRLNDDLSIQITPVQTTKERDVVTIDDFTIGEDIVILPNLEQENGKIEITPSVTNKGNELIKSIDFKLKNIKTEDNKPSSFLSINLSDESALLFKKSGTQKSFHDYILDLISINGGKEGHSGRNLLTIGAFEDHGKGRTQARQVDDASGPANAVIAYDRNSGGSLDSQYWKTTTYSGDDQIYGSDYTESIQTGLGNDIIFPGYTKKGDETDEKKELIDGQGGIDLVSYSNTAPVSIIANEKKMEVTRKDLTTGDPISATLSNIEIIQASPGSSINLTSGAGSDGVQSDESEVGGYIVTTGLGSNIQGSTKNDEFFLSVPTPTTRFTQYLYQSAIKGNKGNDSLTINIEEDTSTMQAYDYRYDNLELKKTGDGSGYLWRLHPDNAVITFDSLEKITIIDNNKPKGSRVKVFSELEGNLNSQGNDNFSVPPQIKYLKVVSNQNDVNYAKSIDLRYSSEISFPNHFTKDSSASFLKNAFEILANGTLNRVTKVQRYEADGLRLHLQNEVTSEQSISLKYTDPTEKNDMQALQGAQGFDSPSTFTPLQVVNRVGTPHGTPYQIRGSSATTTDGKKISILFNKNLEKNNIFKYQDIKVGSDSSFRKSLDIDNIKINDAILEITLSEPLVRNEASYITVTYKNDDAAKNAAKNSEFLELLSSDTMLFSNNSTIDGTDFSSNNGKDELLEITDNREISASNSGESGTIFIAVKQDKTPVNPSDSEIINNIGDQTSNSFDSLTWNENLNNSTGNAILRGNKKNNQIIGDRLKDVIFGEGGNDTLLGFGGDDVIRAGRGNDLIYGGKGRNKIITGKGTDIIHLQRTGYQVIKDFDSSRDILQISRRMNIDDLSVNKQGVIIFQSEAIGELI